MGTNTAGHTVGTQICSKPRLDNRIHTQNSAAEQEIGELFSDVYIKKGGLLIDISGETSILLFPAPDTIFSILILSWRDLRFNRKTVPMFGRLSAYFVLLEKLLQKI